MVLVLAAPGRTGERSAGHDVGVAPACPDGITGDKYAKRSDLLMIKAVASIVSRSFTRDRH